MRSVGGALQALIGVATSVVGALLDAGSGVLGAGARLLEAAGVWRGDASSVDVPEAPTLRALTGGAVRARRGEADVTERPRNRGWPGSLLDDTDLPESYDEDRVVVLPRDPCAIYVYWNLSRATRQRREQMLTEDPSGVLRDALQVEVENGQAVAQGATPRASWTLALAPLAQSAHVALDRPRHAVRVRVGLEAPGGAFSALVGPASAVLPAAAPAEELTPAWRQLAAAEGRAVETPAMPSREAREALLRRAQESIVATSGTGAPGHHVLETDRGAGVPRPV